MEHTTHVAVASLPACVRAALRDVHYGARDIPCTATESVTIDSMAGAGQRGFAVLIDLASGRTETHWGSWGGDNPWSRSAVDRDHTPHVLPLTGVVITGTRGRQTFAHLHYHARSAAGVLAAPAPEITSAERDALFVHRALVSRARPEEMRRRHVRQPTIDRLISRGMLSRNRAGAVSLTTLGRNAVGDWPGY